MPLSSAKPGLEAQIKTALEDAVQSAMEDGDNSGAVIATLAAKLADAINAYTTQAIVNVTIVNTAVVGAGATGPVVGTGVGVGTGVLL